METSNLSIELMNLQSNVIGLFKPWFSKDYEMVVSNDDGFLKTITIGHLFGLQTTHINASKGTLVMFDKGETLSHLLVTGSLQKLNQYIEKVTS